MLTDRHTGRSAGSGVDGYGGVVKPPAALDAFSAACAPRGALFSTGCAARSGGGAARLGCEELGAGLAQVLLVELQLLAQRLLALVCAARGGGGAASHPERGALSRRGAGENHACVEGPAVVCVLRRRAIWRPRSRRASAVGGALTGGRRACVGYRLGSGRIIPGAAGGSTGAGGHGACVHCAAAAAVGSRPRRP